MPSLRGKHDKHGMSVLGHSVFSPMNMTFDTILAVSFVQIMHHGVLSGVAQLCLNPPHRGSRGEDFGQETIQEG